MSVRDPLLPNVLFERINARGLKSSVGLLLDVIVYLGFVHSCTSTIAQPSIRSCKKHVVFGENSNDGNCIQTKSVKWHDLA